MGGWMELDKKSEAHGQNLKRGFHKKQLKDIVMQDQWMKRVVARIDLLAQFAWNSPEVFSHTKCCQSNSQNINKWGKEKE